MKRLLNKLYTLGYLAGVVAGYIIGRFKN